MYNNISQYYCFYSIWDRINAALAEEIIDLRKKI